MVVLNAKKVEYKDPIAGDDYIIVKTKLVKNDQYGESVKVALEPIERVEGDSNIYNAGLWVSETYTPKSKLGCFINAFETYYEEKKDAESNPQDITLWEGHVVRTLSWEPKNNIMKVLKKAPVKRFEALQKALAERQTDN